MYLTTEAPDELLCDGTIPGAFTGDGCILEAVEEVPAGPWLAVVVDSIDAARLTSWEMPAYLRACARVEAWAAALKTGAVAEMAGRSDLLGRTRRSLRRCASRSVRRRRAFISPVGCSGCCLRRGGCSGMGS
jgi:hypothetical protein